MERRKKIFGSRGQTEFDVLDSMTAKFAFDSQRSSSASMKARFNLSSTYV